MNIDLKALIKLSLSPSEYVILDLLYNKDVEILTEFVECGIFDWNNNTTFLGILEHLEHNKWLKIEFDKTTGEVDFQKISLRQKALDLFHVSMDDSKFKTLWSMYPIKVPDGRGSYRILRASGSGTQYDKLKVKWLSIVRRKPLLADVMINALKTQLETTRGSLQYMQMFSVWLNSATWEKYVDIIKDDEVGTSDVV